VDGRYRNVKLDLQRAWQVFAVGPTGKRGAAGGLDEAGTGGTDLENLPAVGVAYGDVVVANFNLLPWSGFAAADN
jgi:hypothetical protein